MTTETAEQIIQEVLEESQAGRRPDIEHELTEVYHVDWKYHGSVRHNAFDAEKSHHNQARFEPIDPETVELYTESVKRGDKFPAVIAWRPTPRARFVMIDGNHRLAAHVSADMPLDMYEIDRTTHPRVIALITFAMNTKHGKPTSEKERIHQALFLVDNGASIDAASTAVSIGPAMLKKALARSKADNRADEVNLRRNEWDSLSATVKTRLANISTDEGFRAAANLAYAAKMDAPEVSALVPQLNASKSGVRQEAIVKAHHDLLQSRIQDGGGGVLTSASKRRSIGPKQRTTMAIAQVLALPEQDSVILSTYTDAEMAKAVVRLRQAADRLIRLADAMDTKR